MLTQTPIRTGSFKQPRAQPSAAPLADSAMQPGTIELMGACMSFAANSEIYGESEPADYLYKVVSGTVRTYKVLVDGRRQIGAFYLPGDIFGVENGDAHRLTAEAIVDTKVLLAKRTRIFGELSEESLTGTREVLKLLSRSLQHAENHLLLLGRQTSVEKVAAFLIEVDRRLQSPGKLSFR